MAETIPTLVGIGEVLWDVFPEGRRLGGAPANFAYHADALGGKGVIVSSVGNDEPGREILDRFGSLGLCRDYVAVDRYWPTGRVTVRFDEQDPPHYVVHENVAWDYIPHSPALLDLAVKADAVCFGSLAQRSPTSRDSIRTFLAAASRSCLRVFDVNLRQSFYDRDIIHDSLALADVLKLNDDELPVLADMLGLKGMESEQTRQIILEYDLRLVALTKGVRGSGLYAQGETSCHPGFRIRVEDTVGAGDAFTAALTLGLLRGMPLDAVNQYANRVAGYVCSQPGAMPRMPDTLSAWS